MIKFTFLILLACMPVQALQILQSEGDNKIIKHQSKIVEESSELSSDLLFTKLEKSAKSGDARSQFSLANMYHNGIGVKTNEKLAFYWYTRVADQGFASAQYNIASGYYHGIGTTTNLNKAFHWYEKAAEQDFVLAQYNLAVMYRKGEGTEVDNKEAFRWYEKAAQSGLSIAEVTLGTLYQHGIGVDQSDALAQIWFLRAATPSNPEAQFRLAEFYQQNGNYSQAVFYYRKAADQGYVSAQFALATSLLEGLGVIKDETKAQRLFLNAAEAGHAQSQFQLGKLFLKQDRVLAARMWLGKASSQSFDLATVLLSDLDIIEQSNKEALELELVEFSQPSVKSDNKKIEIITPIINLTDEILSGLKTQFIQKPITIPDQQQILDSLNSNIGMMNNVEKLAVSAQQGNPIAQHNLSTLYSVGELVAKNDRKAFLLMQQSANQDMASSQAALAMMYANGMGVESNYKKAYYWASISARNGSAEGQKFLLYLVSGTL
ncbi:MAG TPA: sel1 repeat family protein [Candidatus Thioglobus sp.]|nr:sel1 repeat family protein [Candidatus Thioglobus sp.]